jgi:hypothetical protein
MFSVIYFGSFECTIIQGFTDIGVINRYFSPVNIVKFHKSSGNNFLVFLNKMLLHSLGLVYKSMRGVMTNSIERDQWLNVTSESRDRI